MIVQLVISRLRENSTRNEFVDLAREMRDWLQRQPGFVSYELYEGERGWADRIVWNSLEAAKTGNRTFGETEISRKMGELVDPDYRGILGLQVEL